MTKLASLFKGQSLLEIILWAAVTGCLVFSLISISAVQLFLGLGIIAWVVLLILRKRRLELPSFAWPLAGYIVLSLLASALSRDPATSFIDSRDLLLALAVPVAMSAFFSARALRVGLWALLASAAVSSGYSLVYYFLHAAPGLRVQGFMGHYMTQAGLLALFASAALALAFFLCGRNRWAWGLGFVLSLPALGLTLTRSAWIGLVAAACFILLLYKPKALIIIPVLVGLFVLFGPQNMKQRALSIFSLRGFSNAERVEYVRAGLKIIAENPLHGTGPDTVDKIFQYPQYGLSEDAKRNVHLHNNVIQIAAERGLPALLAWLAFLGWAFVGLFRLYRTGSQELKALAVAAMSAVVALFVGGIFEYNFGDSEITCLFYLLLALPFALHRSNSRGDGPSPERLR